jgi:hypothetical protein
MPKIEAGRDKAVSVGGIIPPGPRTAFSGTDGVNPNVSYGGYSVCPRFPCNHPVCHRIRHRIPS